MKNKNQREDLRKKVDTLVEGVQKLDPNDATKVVDTVKELASLLQEVVVELNNHEVETEKIIEDVDVFFSRVEEIEEVLENEILEDEDFDGTIPCPYCHDLITIDEEFTHSDQPKLVCSSCQNEIFFNLSCDCDDEDCHEHNCGCGDDCGCDDNCDCGNDCNCDDNCDCGNDCNCDSQDKK